MSIFLRRTRRIQHDCTIPWTELSEQLPENATSETRVWRCNVCRQLWKIKVWPGGSGASERFGMRRWLKPEKVSVRQRVRQPKAIPHGFEIH